MRSEEIEKLAKELGLTIVDFYNPTNGEDGFYLNNSDGEAEAIVTYFGEDVKVEAWDGEIEDKIQAVVKWI